VPNAETRAAMAEAKAMIAGHKARTVNHPP
jgi:hypothetical protein